MTTYQPKPSECYLASTDYHHPAWGEVSVLTGIDPEQIGWFNALTESPIAIETDEWTMLFDQASAIGSSVLTRLDHNTDTGCTLCESALINLGGVDATCQECGDSRKSDRLSTISQNSQRIVETRDIDHPLQLALRVSLHCPRDHWICSECWISKHVK